MNNDPATTPYTDYGYANGWKEVPPDILKCCEDRKSGEVHDVEGKTIGRCLIQWTCHTCRYTYKVDSSD